MITETQIQAAVDFIRDEATNLAAARANRVILEEMRKCLKARLMKEAEAAGVNSISAQERDAYASKEYEVHIRGLGVAVEIETKLYALIKAAEIKIEAWRTQEASNRRVDKA